MISPKVARVAGALLGAGFTLRLEDGILHAERNGMAWECSPDLLGGPADGLLACDGMSRAIIDGFERRKAQRDSEACRMVPRWTS